LERENGCFLFIPTVLLITCSAEDIVIFKTFADRTRDWMDIESIVLRQGKKLDINYITEHLTPLCELKESPEIIDKLQNIIKDIL